MPFSLLSENCSGCRSLYSRPRHDQSQWRSSWTRPARDAEVQGLWASSSSRQRTFRWDQYEGSCPWRWCHISSLRYVSSYHHSSVFNCTHFISHSAAIRQAIAKGVVAFYQKVHDEASKKEIRDILVAYDRSLIVADPRRCEPKKFGGRGARSRFQKSYR